VQQRAVTVYPDGDDAGQPVDAAVYSELAVRTTSGTPNPTLVGSGMFSKPCG
jgi:hypothetical protein